MGGIMAFFTFKFIRQKILKSATPYQQALTTSPYLIFAVTFILTLSIIFKGLKNLHLDISLGNAILISCLLGFVAFTAARHFFQNRKQNNDVKDEYKQVEGIFSFLQVITACSVAFAHGANDVANAIGPLAVIWSIAKTNTVALCVQVPIGMLFLGGVGIVVGLATIGYPVIDTVGKKITEITPSRGFSAEFATAATVLLCSKMGLPISTTHTLVGAVLGVGFARGITSLNFGIVRNILGSWIITIPGAAILTVVIFNVLTMIY